MGAKASTVGGGPATGLSKEWVDFLSSGLTTGHFGNPGQAFAGADPMGSTTGFAGVLNDVLSSGGGKFGGALGELIANRQKSDIGDLRARFGITGSAFGTPGAYAESSYRAKVAPEIATQVGQLQLSALEPLLQMIMGTSMRGIPQAETVVSQNPWLSGITALGGLLPGVGDIMKGLADLHRPATTPAPA